MNGMTYSPRLTWLVAFRWSVCRYWYVVGHVRSSVNAIATRKGAHADPGKALNMLCFTWRVKETMSRRPWLEAGFLSVLDTNVLFVTPAIH
jgi:hypothetical protein